MLWNVTNFNSSTRWQGANRNNTLPSWIDRRSRSAANMGRNCNAKFWTNQGAASGDWVVIGRGVGLPEQGWTVDEPGRPMRSRSTVLVVAMLAMLPLAGCGHRAPQSVPAPVGLDADTLDLITRGGDFSARFHRVDAADVEATRRCMRAVGFVWTGRAEPVNPQARQGSARSLAEVRENGYGLSN